MAHAEQFAGLAGRVRSILSGAGLVVEEPDFSGRLAVCGTAKRPGGTDGRYKVHLDFPPVVWLCNYHDGGEGQTVPLYDAGTLDAMTEAERDALRERIRKEKEAEEARRAEAHRQAAEKAVRIFQPLPPAGADNARAWSRAGT